MPKLAVLGQPVAHSRSPVMHTAALEEMGLAAEWSYEAIEVGPEQFARRVRAMPSEGFVGANVTVPHKVAALAAATEASVAARAIGAANTLTFTPAGISAENTDTTGILGALPRPARGMRALVLGAGGSARAAIWALREAGADVSVWNRTASRAATVAGELGAGVLALQEGEAVPLRELDLILNATTVGMDEDGDYPKGGMGAVPERGASDLKRLRLNADELNASHVVVDLVYGRAETELAAAARRGGAEVVDGLDVLAHQGAASLRLWTQMEPPIETMKKAARRR